LISYFYEVKGRFMKPVSLFILWLLGFFFITLSCIKFNASTIKNERTQQTHQALANNGSDSVTPTINEQTIIVKDNAVNNDTAIQLSTDSLAEHSTPPITETKTNSVYPPQQISITNKPIENSILNKPNVLVNPSENNIQMPLMPIGNNNGLNMPFWGSNNSPWANGVPMQPWGNNRFMPPMPIQPVAPIAPTAPAFPFETFYPIPMQ
jgi:hypothetical protein